MSKGTILKRLERIEEKYKEDPLIVLARMDSGEEVNMPMRELLEREDAQFIKVIGGSSLKDLELLLKANEAEAWAEVGGKGEAEQ